MKKYLYILIGLSLAFGLTVSAAPTLRYDRTILPETDSLYSLGSALKAWLKIYADEICLAGDCQTAWPAGGSGDFATTTANYWLTTKDTDDLAEGSTNLYYTLARWATALAGTTTDALPEGSTNKYDKTVTLNEGTNITISGTYPDFTIAATAGSGSGTIGTSSDPVIGELAQWTGVDTLASVATSTLNISTSDLIEGSKLFYTQARVWDDVWASSTLATILNNSITSYLWGDHSLVGYLTKAAADLLYQPIGNYLNKDTDTYVVTETDPVWESEKSGYLTSITNLFDQWLDSTSTPIFAGLRLSGLADPAGSFLAVDPDGDLIATTTPSGSGGGTWGTITGTLSDQTDLQNALDDKAGLDTANTFSLHNIFSSLFATNASTTNATTSLLAITGTATYNVYLDFFDQYYTEPPEPATTSPATGASATWSNPTNITASDDSYASKTIDYYGSSGALNATNFGFEIPTGATIDGIVLGVEGKISSGSFVWTTVRLLKNGSAVGDNKTSMSMFTGVDTTLSTGGDSDLWGTTWTAEDINNTNFGATITLEDEDDTTGTVYVDHITIKVYYSVAGKSNFSSSIGIDKDNELFKISTSTGLTGKTIFSYNAAGNVGIGTTPDSSTGLTVSGGISSPMGDDLYNEAFGKNAYIDNTAFNNTTVIGYGASARSGFAKGGNTVIGAWATSTHAANTIIGSNSKSSAGYSVVIGADLTANSANSVLIGSNASISNSATAAIGYSAVADESHSIAIGQGVNTDKQNQFMVGTRMKANAAPVFTLQGAVKAYTPRNIFEIVTEWLDLTDETRQARVKFLTGDYTGALEFMRAETKGGTVDVSFPNGNIKFSGNATTSGYATIGTAPSGANFTSGSLNVQNYLVVPYASTTAFTASGTIYGGSLSIGNGTSQAGCLKIRDSDNDGWTYCSALNGTLSCGTTACSGATLTIGGE